MAGKFSLGGLFGREDADSETSEELGVLHQLPGDTDISELYNYLRAGSRPAVRQRAAERLGNLAEGADDYDEATVVEELTRAVVTDDDDRVRAEAIDALYLHGEENLQSLLTTLAQWVRRERPETDVRTFFCEWLDADHPEFRLVAVTAMRSLTVPAVADRLAERFDDPDDRVQIRAIRAYADLDEGVSVEPLQPLLRDDNARVRHATATALATIGTADALRALVPAARADSQQLRTIAVEQLHALDTRQSGQLLLQSLTDPSPAVRRAAVVSLVRLFATGDAVSGRSIRRVLTTELAVEDQTTVARLLRDVIDEASDRLVQRHAAWLLGGFARIEDRTESRRWLVECLTHTDEVVADVAVGYLRQLDGEVIEKQLRLVIQDDTASQAATERARTILDKIQADVAEQMRDRSIRYVYVRRPSDYTPQRPSAVC